MIALWFTVHSLLDVIFQDIGEGFLRNWTDEEFHDVELISQYVDMVQQIKNQFEKANAKLGAGRLTEEQKELHLCKMSYNWPPIHHVFVRGDRFTQHMKQLIRVFLFSIFVAVLHIL